MRLGNKLLLYGKVVANSTKEADSGGGWHRDAVYIGLKAILYLSDVHADNGPFTMLIGYDDSRLRPRDRRKFTRFDDATIDSAIHRGYARSSVKVTGSAGTLVFFETHNIHRGSAFKSGTREALTLYFNPSVPVPKYGGQCSVPTSKNPWQEALGSTAGEPLDSRYPTDSFT